MFKEGGSFPLADSRPAPRIVIHGETRKDDSGVLNLTLDGHLGSHWSSQEPRILGFGDDTRNAQTNWLSACLREGAGFRSFRVLKGLILFYSGRRGWGSYSRDGK